jgi:hypothetical protein
MFVFRHRGLTGKSAVAMAAVAVLIGCGMKSSLPVGEPEELTVAGSGGAAGSDDQDDQGDLDSGVDAANHCGNGIIEPEYGEQCDGTDLGGATCNSLREGPGRLRCGPACFFDVTMCEYRPPTGYGDGGDFGDGGPGSRPGDGGPVLGPVF